MIPFPPDQAKRFRREGHWGDKTIYGMFSDTVARVPDREALIDPPNRSQIVEGEPRRFTYAQMSESIDAIAEALRSAGLGQGSLVASQLPNASELILLYFAVTKIGAVLSPISLAYRSAELRALCETIDFDAYVSIASVAGSPYFDERRDALPEGVTLMGFGSGLQPGIIQLDEPVDLPARPATQRSADDLFAVFWTSGTEGRPKAVPKTHNNMMASSLGAWRLLGLPDGANILAPFPFVNAAAMGGLLMCWMRTAGALVLHHPFDLETFLNQLGGEDVTYTMVAPTVLAYLRDRAEDPVLGDGLGRALLRLKAIGTGSAPPDPELFGYFRDRFDVQILNFFGSNEGAQLCSSEDRVADPRKRARYFPRDGDVNWSGGPGSLTANGGTFKLVDPESGTPVTQPGAIGEMKIMGPAVMPGYISREGYDRSRFDADGFLATSDLFEISDCGNLMRFHARSRELIVRGGMKISPVELDNFLAAMPGIREVAVAAYAHETLGEKVCVFAVCRDGHALTLDDVLAFCHANGIAKFKWPERLMLLDALPRTPLAKLDRRALAAILAERTPTPQREREHA